MAPMTLAPVLVVMTGLPGTGKSALAEAVGRALPAPVFSVDPLEATLNRAGITREHRSGHVAYDLAATLAERQLAAGQSAVVDAVNAQRSLRTWWMDIAQSHGVALVMLASVCSDQALHRQRLGHRTRPIEGFLYDVTWDDVQAGIADYEPATESDIVLDAVDPLEENIGRVVRHLSTLGR